MVDPTPQPTPDARAAMRACEDQLAAAIVAYGAETRDRWRDEGQQDVPVDAWEDTDRFGKWRGGE